LFLIFEDQTVHMLDVSTGTLTRLADNRDSFSDAVDQGDNANVWLMLSLVDQCVSKGITLAENQCYGFKLPPILGGNYSVENIEPTDLSVYYSFMADISCQAKDIPNGTKVKIVIKR
jgi:hypothetical protein